nr:p53 and DNA damage-regulated protein 1-like isoform X1 [Rhipicephalus microplus]
MALYFRMNPATARVKQYLADIELTAETILADKEQVVELDRRRQKNREALRALKQLEEDIHRPWVCIGNMFMKIPRHRTKELLEQEQEKLENEIGSLRKKLKKNVQSLREMEGRSEVQGFSLEPLSREEMQAISQAMGQGM